DLGMRLLPFQDDAVHRAAFGRTAADQPLDAVLRHEVERPFAAALDRLPALDRPAQWPRHEGQLLQLIAAIRHLRRQGVVLALMREAGLVERLEYDLDLLFEDLAVGVLVDERPAEGFDLAGVIAAADSEHGAAFRQDVGG